MVHHTQVSRRSFLRGAGVVAGSAALAACTSKAKSVTSATASASPSGAAPSAVTGASSGAASASAAPIKSGTLTVMSVAGEITNEQIGLFESAYPELKLNIIDYDVTRLNSMIAAGTPPDLVRDAGTDVTPYIATRGLALDLDPYFAKSSVIKADDILPINDVWKWDGKVQGQGPRYGMAKDWSQDAMWWYNPAAWQAAGLTEPDPATPVTYDDLLEWAPKLTKASGGKTSVYGLFTTSPSHDFISAMVATDGGKILSDDLATADFTSPEAQKALTWLVNAAKAKVGYSAVNPSPDWDGPEYLAGHQVSVDAGYWFGGFLDSNNAKLEATTKFAAAPMLGSTRVSPSFGAVGYWIPAKAKNPEGSFAFLEWYCGGEGARARAAAGDGLPALKSYLTLLPQQTDFQKQSYTVQQAELPYLKVLGLASPYALGSALDTAIAKIFPSAVTGSTTVAQLGDQMTSAANAVLAQGKKAAGG
jgi:multiple sugar transport system substrate-binding protein